MKKALKLYVLILILCLFVYHCGVALTPKATVKIPRETNTEIFRLNLFHGEVETLYGMNIGLVNIIVSRMIGTQIGLLNSVNYSEGKGFQVGILNNSGFGYYGLKLGIFNFNFSFFGDPMPGSKVEEERRKIATALSIGMFNFNNAFNIGIFNVGRGINVGVFNAGASFSLGVVNGSGEPGLSVGAINIGSNGNLQIGIVNYCPNNTIPIMIIANYCAKE
ncbi:LA_2272/LA_2273 family lipoprotein [Leptospira alstonii]|uniref:PPE family protein n=2 Tax=Leptospira alstonii TaxID=28452 RepID=M6D509_9LEPT|nr:hypothetical protein [Leptospira alstonii]EMJ93630.1 hypothetical protein LEP1GSC194_1742 [Leptospira alstonii serovar Sichuan str. 79601]EQA81368.1 hypothetical protein LEP1GSC193_1952 [Leptospira alstonii serovar Pingchang str. 80-412]